MALLFRWLSRCPLSVLHIAGYLVGWVIFLVSPTYRRRFKTNVRQAGLRTCVALPAVAETGRMLLELPYVWLRPPDDRISERVEWRGDALIRAAIARGKGVMLLTPHMGCFEVAAQSYAESHGPITVLYRPARKEWLRNLVDTARPRQRLATAPATLAGVRQLLRALRRGEAIGLLPDQVPPNHMGIWARFFGRPAYTMTLAARLAQQVDATVLLVWSERLPWARGYVVHVAPFAHPEAPLVRLTPRKPPEQAPKRPAEQKESAVAGQSATVDPWALLYAETINAAMETLIRRRPDQYLWAYDRYKEPRSVLSGLPQSQGAQP